MFHNKSPDVYHWILPKYCVFFLWIIFQYFTTWMFLNLFSEIFPKIFHKLSCEIDSIYFTIFYETLHANVRHKSTNVISPPWPHGLTASSRHSSEQPLRVASSGWQHFCPCQLLPVPLASFSARSTAHSYARKPRRTLSLFRAGPRILIFV